VKIAAGVGVELRQIYLPGRRSHHPSDAPQQTSPNPNYKTEERDLPLHPAAEAAIGGRGINAHTTGDLGIWEVAAALSLEGDANRS
jgi:hypothetical protein